MYGARAARVRRFSLLLLEEEEEYVQDWVVTAAWPVERVAAGNWQRAPLVAGRVRLCTRSLFFEPDDLRVPIVRIPLAAVKSMSSGPPVAAVAAQAAAAAAASTDASGSAISPPTPPTAVTHGSHRPPNSGGPSLLLETREVVLMRANMEEVPYTFLKAPREGAGGGGGGVEVGGAVGGYRWAFGPCYSPLQPLLSQAAALLEINRRPRELRSTALEELSRQRMDGVSFDLSRLLDFGERVVWSGPVLALTPLVREQGHLAITPARVYFQPLHNIAGDTPVKSHPLAAIAAVARRRSSLRPVGLELFFIHPTTTPGAAATTGAGVGSGSASSPGGRPRQHNHHHHHHQQAVAAAAAVVGVSGPMWDAPSAFFAFRSETDREAARHLLTIQPELGRCVPRHTPPPPLPHSHHHHQQQQQQQQPAQAQAGGASGGIGGGGIEVLDDPLAAHGLLLEAAGPWLRRVTAAWQRGSLTNFDYLMYLNFAAGRSFNDLAQWPVFPWVLRNYVSATLDLNDPNNFRDLSKPVGALNPTRLEEFRKRFRDMPHDSFEGSVPPFLYGTHYSTPGYVMYWLVRAAPSHMLRLQNGRFDAPDRLFASVQEAWEGVLHSTTDVKELIPEFFMPGWDFLVNHRRLPLGVRQNGRSVDDVELPPWATGPRDFLAKHRAALESPAVSRQLHAWIDLIFGYKQRGEAAEAADNVFYYLTYEGAVDVAAVASQVELKALETQINEFGQTPKQLFTTPHPPRLVCPPAPDPATIFPEDRGGDATSVAATAATATAMAAAGPGTGYGGEGDAGNRDLALALLSTIMAAAAPEYGAPAAAVAAEGSSDGGGTAAEAQLPPAAQPERAGAVAATAATAASVISGFLKLGRYQQQQQQQQQNQQQQQSQQTGTGPGVPALAEVSSSPSPPYEAASSRVSGAMSGLASVASAPAAVAGAASALLSSIAGVFHHNAGGGGGGGGGSRRSTGDGGVSGGAGSGGASGTTGNAGTTGLVTAAAHGAGGGGVANGGGGGGSAGAGSGWSKAADWGWGPLCRRPFRTVAWSQLTRGSLAAVTSGRNGYLYCAGQSGIRVLAETAVGADAAPGADATGSGGGGLTVVRSAHLDGELLSLTLLPIPGSGGGGGGAAAAPRHQRLMLSGSHNRKVYAYSPDAGRVMGSFEAHDDAVCCVQLMSSGGGGGGEGGAAATSTALVTSSWDCSVKIWSLAEGRAPWATGLSFATVELRDFESGVWALATDPWDGPLLATGTEEGVVALWDTRAPGRGSGRPGCGCVWQTQVAQDYVGGLALITAGAAAAATAPVMVLAATADGALTLYDVRVGGSSSSAQRLASVACGAPVRCCAADSRAAVAGDESGAVRLWDVGLMAGGTEPVRPGGPEPDGLYPAWEGVETGGAAVSGLDVYKYPYGNSGAAVRLAVVTEGGRLVVLETGAGSSSGGSA